MEYGSSTMVEIPAIVSCNNCDLWFFSESGHCCSWPSDMNMNTDIHKIVTIYD